MAAFSLSAGSSSDESESESAPSGSSGQQTAVAEVTQDTEVIDKEIKKCESAIEGAETVLKENEVFFLLLNSFLLKINLTSSYFSFFSEYVH